MLQESVNFVAKHITSRLAISDLSQCLTKTPTYITRKDLKPNFHVSIQ